MAIEDIIRQIDEDAKSEAESMLSRARAEAETIAEKAKKNADRLCAEETKNAEDKAKEHGRRIETLAGLELRKEVLRQKKILIGEAFARAEEKIIDLPADEYIAFLRPIILCAVESGREELIASVRHRDLFTPGFIQSLNAELGPQKGNLRLSDESGDFSGGFILRDGRKETNMTLHSLIESQRDNLEPKVAGILFGENARNG